MYETDKIPRPTEVKIAGSWDDWSKSCKMVFDERRKNWSYRAKLTPGKYYFKYFVDNEWILSPKEEVEIDFSNHENHVVLI